MTDDEDFKRVKAFAFDVDGVLTDGRLIATDKGELYRLFDSKDGFAFRMASMHGYYLAIITGGRSESIRKRFQTCGIPNQDIFLGSRDKIKDFNTFCENHWLSPDEVIYMGDDIPDIEVMKACGIGACPADSVPEVLEIADYVSPRKGGEQCAREIIEKVMRLHEQWELDVKMYEERF